MKALNIKYSPNAKNFLKALMKRMASFDCKDGEYFKKLYITRPSVDGHEDISSVDYDLKLIKKYLELSESQFDSNYYNNYTDDIFGKGFTELFNSLFDSRDQICFTIVNSPNDTSLKTVLCSCLLEEDGSVSNYLHFSEDSSFHSECLFVDFMLNHQEVA